MKYGPYYWYHLNMSNVYRVVIETSAAKQIARLARHDQSRLRVAIDGLATEPRPHNAIKMGGMTDTYRMRVGSMRVIYVIDDGLHIVSVTKAGHRGDVYK